jgi:hypothetical protein
MTSSDLQEFGNVKGKYNISFLMESFYRVQKSIIKHKDSICPMAFQPLCLI